MKKTALFTLTSIFSISSLTAKPFLTDYAQSLFKSVKTLLKKQDPVVVPARQAPTINVGYLSLKESIKQYEEIVYKLKAFADNDVIDIILIDLKCGGGLPGASQIIGEFIMHIKTAKPVIAFVSEYAFSGGYLIASSCSHIIAPSVADIGSIGSVIEFDQGAAKDPTHVVIKSGKYKAYAYDQDGKLTEDHRNILQENVDETAFAFFNHVARCRNIPVEDIKNFEARCFSGFQSLKIGLIDQVGTLHDVIKKISEMVSDKQKKSFEQVAFINTDNVAFATFDLNE